MYMNYTHHYAMPSCKAEAEAKYPISRGALMFVREIAGFNGSGTCRLQVAKEALALLNEPGMQQIKAFLSETGFRHLHGVHLRSLQNLQVNLERALADD